MPDASLERVFEPFHREVAPGHEGRPGTGIGLAVVRGLVTAMGGSTRAFRSPLGGLGVELDLPLATLPAELAAPTAPATLAAPEAAADETIRLPATRR